MKKITLLFTLFLTFSSCVENDKLKTEIQILKTELSNCKTENSELKKTPQSRLLEAQKSQKNNQYKLALAEYNIIITNFPESVEAKISKKEIPKLKKLIKKEHEKANAISLDKQLHPEKYLPKISDEQAMKLLSDWDGSLPSLVKYTKDNLHNPKSFEHVETGISNKGYYLKVKMIYRAENGFGAIRKYAIVAKVDGKGKILSIISQ